MFWLKACPKCGGDLWRQSIYGDEDEIACIQCGRRATAEELARLRSRTAHRRRRAILVLPKGDRSVA